jgi:hypothetical protein
VKRSRGGGAVPKIRGRIGERKPTLVPVRSSFQIKALDPYRKCGPGTTVQRLYRIDESVDGVVRSHLVYLDRHGWYCEHGRDCVAVAPARQLDGSAR